MPPGEKMNTDIENFLASHEYAPSTRATYARLLTALITDIPDLSNISASDLVQWVTRPQWGGSHRYVALTASKSFIRWRYGSAHPALIARTKRTSSGHKQRSLTKDQVNKLLASFDRYTVKGARDLAIAALAIDSGLRVSELCNLRDDDTDTQECACYVTIKGGSAGRGCFTPQTAAHIDHWRAMRGHKTDNLFTSTRSGKKLTREGLQTIVKKWGAALGYKLSPHDFRRTMTRHEIKNGAPTRTVQLAGRWANIDMVELYSRDLEQDDIRPYLPLNNL
jgi:integrase